MLTYYLTFQYVYFVYVCRGRSSHLTGLAHATMQRCDWLQQKLLMNENLTMFDMLQEFCKTCTTLLF